MLRLAWRDVSRTQSQLVVQGVCLLIGLLLIVVGIECLDAQKIALQHHECATPKVCSIK